MLRLILSFLSVASMTLAISGCKTMTDMLKEKITLEQTIERSRTIDQTENPAKKVQLEKQLKNKRIILSNITVTKVIESSNAHYDFCAIADITSSAGAIECYIYSSDVKTLAALKAGSSQINVEADYFRLYVLTDNKLILDLTDAKITIVQ